MSNNSVPIGQTLLTRALNATRPTYFPSYVGLRLIGAQMPLDNTGYLERMIVRRINAGDHWRYRSFKLYKGTTIRQGEAEHAYRDCLAPSPCTAIAEAVILAMLSNDPAFKVPERVYSYRWPKSAFSGGSYEYFAEGFRQRNLEVANALQPGAIAVVTDIKSFYPSVSSERLLTALRTRLTKPPCNLKESAEEIVEFFRCLLDVCSNGIPIGPASAHVLGHLALAEVDQELTTQFGINYFRYVDDIVVVGSDTDQRKIEKMVESTLRRHGFEPNTDKTVVLQGDRWQQSVLRPDVTSVDSFRAFASDLTAYLAFHPDRAVSLRTAFRYNCLAVPVSRLLAISRYSRFRYFLRRRKAPDGLGQALKTWLSKDDEFIQRGLKLKASYEQALDSLIQEPCEIDPSFRRWQVQRVRRVVNTLFYLRDFSEWRSKFSQLDEYPELVEQRAVAFSLYSGNVSPILPFYGRGASAFSELWNEYGETDASFEWPEGGLSTPELESLVALQLHGTLAIGQLPLDERHTCARLAKIAWNDHPGLRSSPDLSYEDELESLRLSWSNDGISHLARTRYSLTETTALDALALMSSEYRS